MNSLIFKIKNCLVQKKLIKKGEKLAAAVSGGPDSVAMLFCLNALKKDLGFDLAALHINHMLRGDASDKDESFVKNLAKNINIPFYSARVDVSRHRIRRKCSVQVAAREMRYFHLNRLIKEHSIVKIAMGHTANDQAETVLMRVLKGAGLSGISGIPQIRNNIYIRPLLEITREEVEQFLNQNQIKYSIDSTNLTNNYLRNRIKNRLIPSLKKEFNPSIIDTLCRSSQIFRTENDYIAEMAHNEFKKLILEKNSETLILNAKQFQNLHTALKRRIILDAIYQFPNSGRHVSQKIIENILRVMASNISGKSISIFNGFIFKYQYGRIIFQTLKKISAVRLIKQKKLVIPGKTNIPEIGKVLVSSILKRKDISKDFSSGGPFTAFIDYSDFGKELVVRSRQNGDKFSPLGTRSNKKLKNYFIDKKVPKEERDSIPLLAHENSILWAIGYQISELVKIKKHTENIFMMEVS